MIDLHDKTGYYNGIVIYPDGGVLCGSWNEMESLEKVRVPAVRPGWDKEFGWPESDTATIRYVRDLTDVRAEIPRKIWQDEDDCILYMEIDTIFDQWGSIAALFGGKTGTEEPDEYRGKLIPGGLWQIVDGDELLATVITVDFWD